MIYNAKDVKISTVQLGGSGLPCLSAPVENWSQPIEFQIVGKRQVDFKTVETFITKMGKGVIRPLSPQQLALKPEGERAWRWKVIHSAFTLELNVDDVIQIDSIRYRVMSKTDSAQYGYFKYEIAEAFIRGGAC